MGLTPEQMPEPNQPPSNPDPHLGLSPDFIPPTSSPPLFVVVALVLDSLELDLILVCEMALVEAQPREANLKVLGITFTAAHAVPLPKARGTPSS